MIAIIFARSCERNLLEFLFHARITCVLSSIGFFLHHTSVSPFNWSSIMIKYFQEPRLDKRRIAGKDVCIVCRSLARASPDRAPCSINVKVHQPLIDFLQLPPDYHPFSILGKVDIRAITKQPPTQTNTSRHEALHCCCLTDKYPKN